MNEVLAMIGVAALALTPGQEGKPLVADQAQLAEIDRTFVCPESLPNDAARMEAVAKFIAAMQKAAKEVTVAQLVEARMSMLEKHQCQETLANIHRNTPQ